MKLIYELIWPIFVVPSTWMLNTEFSLATILPLLSVKVIHPPFTVYIRLQRR